MRVLLIEDDSNIAQSIELMLKSESFNVHTTDFGEDGVDLGKVYDYDIILLDLNLPDISGFDVLRALRVSKLKTTPILILLGRAGIEDKVRGLGYGADDYMTKPFHKDELVARIHAIARRSREQQPAPFRMPADCESARHRRDADAAHDSRRGDRIAASFAALYESAPGTQETCQPRRRMVRLPRCCGRQCCGAVTRAIDPSRKWSVHRSSRG